MALVAVGGAALPGAVAVPGCSQGGAAAGPAYYHRDITRLRAEELLFHARKDGAFLVRDSESVKGAFALCLLFRGCVYQYRILAGPDECLAVQADRGVVGKKYKTLVDLINDYNDDNNGLVCPLRHPVAMETNNDDEDDDDDDDENENEGVDETLSPLINGHVRPRELTLGGVNNNNNPNANVIVVNGNNNNNAFPANGVRSGDAGGGGGVADRLQRRLSCLNTNDVDNAFVQLLVSYVEEGARRDAVQLQSQVAASAAAASVQPHYLNQLVLESAAELSTQLDAFLRKISVLHRLFSRDDDDDDNDDDPSSSSSPRDANDDDLAALQDRLSRCRSAVSSMRKKAALSLKDSSSAGDALDSDPRFLDSAHPSSQRLVDGLPSPDVRPLQPDDFARRASRSSAGMKCVPMLPSPTNRRPNIPLSNFLVKQESTGPLSVLSLRETRLTLTVDIQGGKLFAVKNDTHVLDDSNTFVHEKILQLIKSVDNNSKLGLVVEGRKRDDVLFENSQARENFCQLVQQLKNLHTRGTEPDQISIFVGSWNMSGVVPPHHFYSWFRSKGMGKTRDAMLHAIPHDIYVIGTQESSMQEKEWVEKLKSTLKKLFFIEFLHIATESSWGLRLVVLAKPEHALRITHLEQSTVKTGLANALGNKGAVGVSFLFNGTSFCFINCHLASGAEKCDRRNQNFRDILRGLNLGQAKAPFDLVHSFHHIFWLGCLNYMVDCEPKAVIQAIKTRQFPWILQRDQLGIMQRHGLAFAGFKEESVNFPPTYRFQKGNRSVYEWQRTKKTGLSIYVPSWCDRVLWRSFPDTHVVNTSYGCPIDLTCSTHSPVFSSFDVGIFSQFSGKGGAQARNEGASIVFDTMEAEVRTMSKLRFYLEFHSVCLEYSVKSKANKQYDTWKEGPYCCPLWTTHQLPTLIPIIADRDYLEDQHLLVAVKGIDEEESYGECCISLKNLFVDEPAFFQAALQHRGEETGRLCGKLHVRLEEDAATDAARPARRRPARTYELISLEREARGMQHQQQTSMQQQQYQQRDADFPLVNYTHSPHRNGHEGKFWCGAGGGSDTYRLPYDPSRRSRRSPRRDSSFRPENTETLLLETRKPAPDEDDGVGCATPDCLDCAVQQSLNFRGVEDFYGTTWTDDGRRETRTGAAALAPPIAAAAAASPQIYCQPPPSTPPPPPPVASHAFPSCAPPLRTKSVPPTPAAPPPIPEDAAASLMMMMASAVPPRRFIPPSASSSGWTPSPGGVKNAASKIEGTTNDDRDRDKSPLPSSSSSSSSTSSGSIEVTSGVGLALDSILDQLAEFGEGGAGDFNGGAVGGGVNGAIGAGVNGALFQLGSIPESFQSSSPSLPVKSESDTAIGTTPGIGVVDSGGDISPSFAANAKDGKNYDRLFRRCTAEKRFVVAQPASVSSSSSASQMSPASKFGVSLGGVAGVLSPTDSTTSAGASPESPGVISPSNGAVKVNVDYAKLSRPKSVAEWLRLLGLGRHAAAFRNNGWDQLEFLSALAAGDLDEMNIVGKEEQARILESIKEMGKG